MEEIQGFIAVNIALKAEVGTIQASIQSYIQGLEGETFPYDTFLKDLSKDLRLKFDLIQDEFFRFCETYKPFKGVKDLHCILSNLLPQHMKPIRQALRDKGDVSFSGELASRMRVGIEASMI
jgi:hypothetical protein